MELTNRLSSSSDLNEICALFSQITGKPAPEGFALFPPFYMDFGKNITVEKGVFINSGCHFQDQGGITIGEGSLIGHNVVLATLNLPWTPPIERTCFPRPSKLGKMSGSALTPRSVPA